ncbi:hypothetical protein SAMN05892883_3349 [Jatrophihabitans sp. GAS493]|nr:hypothetical protein SAMN05892883_3349 [Jatrophihabitans sp. GAS493]
MPGFGRGPPEPALPPGRAAGRGGIPGVGAAPAGRGAAGRVLGELPPTPKGLLPTLGPGRGPAAGRAEGASATGAASAATGAGAGAAGASGAAGAGAAASNAGAGTTGAVSTTTGAAGAGAGVGGADTAASTGAGAGAGTAFLAGAFFAGAATASGNASRTRRATGGSIVEDALLTNSPISPSLARTSLLVTPSSFASADTRVLPVTGLL